MFLLITSSHKHSVSISSSQNAFSLCVFMDPASGNTTTPLFVFKCRYDSEMFDPNHVLKWLERAPQHQQTQLAASLWSHSVPCTLCCSCQNPTCTSANIGLSHMYWMLNDVSWYFNFSLVRFHCRCNLEHLCTVMQSTTTGGPWSLLLQSLFQVLLTLSGGWWFDKYWNINLAIFAKWQLKFATSGISTRIFTP